MSSTRPAPRWLFLLTPKWLGWHVFVAFATVGMLWLGDWQFHRAESGNALSWAYTFEWPVFAVFAVVFWVKTIIDELKPPAADDENEEIELPPAGISPERWAALARRADSRVSADDDSDGQPDPELAAYNDYLARLNEQVQGHGRWHGLR